jgi:hypothetical protein
MDGTPLGYGALPFLSPFRLTKQEAAEVECMLCIELNGSGLGTWENPNLTKVMGCVPVEE